MRPRRALRAARDPQPISRQNRHRLLQSRRSESAASKTIRAGRSIRYGRDAEDVVAASMSSSNRPASVRTSRRSRRRSDVRFTSASALWFAEHPDARTICVTGTKGKSTVTALIAHLLRAGGRRVALAGNIGLPLLELLDPPQEPDWWVIELSSFQTRDFGGAPTVAVINNLYEEHLDWHGSAERYVEDKLRIARTRGSIVVAPASLDGCHRTRSSFRQRRRLACSRRRDLPRAIGACSTSRTLPLPGEHNAHNVCAALAAIEAAGEDATSLAAHVRTFRPLPHRLQTLGERDGIALRQRQHFDDAVCERRSVAQRLAAPAVDSRRRLRPRRELAYICGLCGNTSTRRHRDDGREWRCDRRSTRRGFTAAVRCAPRSRARRRVRASTRDHARGRHHLPVARRAELRSVPAITTNAAANSRGSPVSIRQPSRRSKGSGIA